MNARRMTLLVALLLAVGTGWLTINYLTSLKQAQTAPSAPQSIIVAATPIPPHTLITPEMLARTTRPAAAIDPGAILDPKMVIGSISLVAIPAGSSINQSEIGQSNETGLEARLPKGTRAISISIDKVKGVSGFIQPGDYVDIIALPPRSSGPPIPAVAIMRHILVLAVGTFAQGDTATPPPGGLETASTITFQVTSKQADLLMMVDQATTLRLTLRPPHEPIRADPTESFHFDIPPKPTVPTVGQLGLNAPRVAPTPIANVPVIEGDHYSLSPQSASSVPSPGQPLFPQPLESPHP